MFQQRIIAEQKFLSINFAEQSSFFYPSPQASMVDKMTAGHPPQECFLFIRTSNTLQFLDLYIQFLALDNIPSGILTEIARQRSRQSLIQSSKIGQLHPDKPSLVIHFLLCLPIFAISPFLLTAIFEDERVSDVLTYIEASCTKGHILTSHTFVNRFRRLDLLELATIAVVIKLLANLPTVDILQMLILLQFKFLQVLGWLLIPAQGAFNHAMFRHLMLSPLGKTFDMEGILAFLLTDNSGIPLDNLHLTNRTHVFRLFLQILVSLLHDDLGQALLGVLEELGDLVGVDDPAGDNISQLLIGIVALAQQGMAQRQVEYLGQHVDGVDAVAGLLGVAGALNLVADSDLEFDCIDILKDKAGPARDADQIESLLTEVNLSLQHFEPLLLHELSSLLFLFRFACHIFIFKTHYIIYQSSTSPYPLLETVHLNTPSEQFVCSF